MDYTVRIGGEAGQGVQTIGEVLSLVFASAGYHVFTHQDYESRVRGGHNFYQIRVSDMRVMSSKEGADIVIALDRAGTELHRNELADNGIIAYDSETLKMKSDDPAFLDVPFRRLAVEEGEGQVMANTVATGAVLGMLGMETTGLEELLKARFKKKGSAVAEGNVKAARAGFRHAKENCRQCGFLSSSPADRPKILINGQVAAATGALASGLKFYSAYPMTPSTGIMNHIASKAEQYGVIVEQAEDEIAAINMALGASFSGVRAATGSSGGGVALMVEGISLAGITETPVVIFDSQRPGPATGLPTRTEQADLLFIIHTGHGEFPRAVFAPGSPEQAVFLTNKAFDLADKYQIPVFVLIDQYLADSQWTYDVIDPDRLVYRDYRLKGDALGALSEYKRHSYTDSGVSALAAPGESSHLVVTDSDEHDEDGHLTEDAPTRNRMVEKRLFLKLGDMRKEINPPLLYGSGKPDILLTGWGSTYGVMKEAVDVLNEEGRAASMLFFSEIYPMPDGDYMSMLEDTGTTVCIEGNATGQLANLIRMEKGFEFSLRINKYDGRPFTVEYIMRKLENADT
jgi:2-oxoglutarate ferredoxin oxidoreductase subunit alpha